MQEHRGCACVQVATADALLRAWPAAVNNPIHVSGLPHCTPAHVMPLFLVPADHVHILESHLSHPEFVDYFFRTRERRGIVLDRRPLREEWEAALRAMDIHQAVLGTERHHTLVDAIVAWLCASTEEPNWPDNREPCIGAVAQLREELKLPPCEN